VHLIRQTLGEMRRSGNEGEGRIKSWAFPCGKGRWVAGGEGRREKYMWEIVVFDKKLRVPRGLEKKKR